MIRSIDKAATIFCSAIFSEFGTLLNLHKYRAHPTTDKTKYTYLMAKVYSVNSGLTTKMDEPIWLVSIFLNFSGSSKVMRIRVVGISRFLSTKRGNL